MKITVIREFDPPREAVFARFAATERMRALIEDTGGRVEAVIGAEGAPEGAAGPGTVWQGAIVWRGLSRPFTLTLAEAQPARLLRYRLEAPQFEVALAFDFAERPGGGTRISARARPQPKGALGRMAMQGLRLMRARAKGRLRRAMAFLGEPSGPRA